MREYVLTALDPDKMLTYTVVFQPVSATTTNLVLGESNLALRKKEGDDNTPLFPGAKDVLRSQQEGTSTVAYRADTKPEDVQSFYREVFGKSGFVERDPALAPGVFSRGSEEVSLLVHQAPGKPLAITLVFREGHSP